MRAARVACTPGLAPMGLPLWCRRLRAAKVVQMLLSIAVQGRLALSAAGTLQSGYSACGSARLRSAWLHVRALYASVVAAAVMVRAAAQAVTAATKPAAMSCCAAAAIAVSAVAVHLPRALWLQPLMSGVLSGSRGGSRAWMLRARQRLASSALGHIQGRGQHHRCQRCINTALLRGAMSCHGYLSLYLSLYLPLPVQMRLVKWAAAHLAAALILHQLMQPTQQSLALLMMAGCLSSCCPCWAALSCHSRQHSNAQRRNRQQHTNRQRMKSRHHSSQWLSSNLLVLLIQLPHNCPCATCHSCSLCQCFPAS